MSLCVAMIARDEAARIGASLESVRGYADQIVVVDSGSKDATPDIARAHGAIVVPFEWCDDFAAARNAAIPHISTCWTLWLDADELLDRTTAGALQEMLARRDVQAFGLVRRDYMGGFKPGAANGDFVSSIVLRLFRNDLDIHFTGRCHEQPTPSADEIEARTGLKLMMSTVTLDHDCDYYFEGRFRKSARNGRLLDLEVRERPGRLYWLVQCGATLLDMPDTIERGKEVMRDALEQVRKIRDNPRPPFGLVELALEYAAYMPASEALPLSPDEAAELAERWFPNAVPVIWMRARKAFEKGDHEAAIPILRRLVKMGQTRVYDIEVPFDGAIIGDDARLNLGVCLFRTGEIDEAEEVFKQIDPKGRRGEEAAINLKSIEKVREEFAE